MGEKIVQHESNFIEKSMSNTTTEQIKESTISKQLVADSSLTLGDKIAALMDKGNAFEQKDDSKSALDATNEAWVLCNQNNDIKFEPTKLAVLHRLTQLHFKRKDYKKLEELSELMLLKSKQLLDGEREVAALTNMAIVKSVASDYKEAMPLFVEALDKSQKVNLRFNAANCLINIGTIYASVYNYEEALVRYKQVLSDYVNVLNDNTHIAVYLNTGNLYYASEQYPLSLKSFQKALDLSLKHDNKGYAAHAYSLKSRTYLALNKIDKAIENAESASNLMLSLTGNTPGRQINLFNLAQIEFLTTDTEGAIKRAKHALAVARRVKDDTSELRGFKLLSDIFKKKGDFEMALRCQTLYAHKQEEHLKTQRIMHALDIEIRYALREKEAKIEELTKENEYQSLLLEQSSQIEKQNELLRQANEELKQFAYISSHDLKEPLRMIGSFAQLVQQQLGENMPEQSKGYFQYINEGVTRMHGLLDALLHYATIGNLNFELETVHVKDIVGIARTNLKVVIEETNTNILCGDMPEVKAVPSFLVQLFQNLFSNAIKFRHPDSRPVILVNSEERDLEWVFSVQDNGIGIADEHKERIFVIFQRLHTRAKYEGTGIGLAICQKIVAQLGGKIWVESQPGLGCTFFFSIPK
jgi:signal transduction histidine kinase